MESSQDTNNPVAWCHLSYNDDGSSIPDSLQHCPDSYCTTPLYTAPPKRQPLTDEQIKGLIEEGVFFGNCKEIVRAIEAAHGIKKGGQHGTE